MGGWLLDGNRSTGFLGELFRLHRLLGGRDRRRSDSGVNPFWDVEAEREAWKQHFQAIQAGAGAVPDRVWRYVDAAANTAEWLGRPPLREEVERAIGQMRNLVIGLDFV